MIVEVDEETGDFFKLVMTSKDLVYVVPIGNSCGFVITLSLVVIEADGVNGLANDLK